MQYQGFGAFGQQQGWQQPPPPPKKRRGALIATISISAVVLIAAVTAGVVLTSRGDDRAQPAPAPTTRSSEVPTSVRTAPPAAQREPLVPGWQVAEVPRRSAVYDVPGDWEIDPDPEAVYGYGEPQDAVTVTGVATYRRGFCTGEPNSYRATAGATARRGPDDATVATETSQRFIAKAYGRDGLAPIAEAAPPERIRLPGGMSAVRIDTKVTLPNPQRCDAPVVEVSVMATNNDGAGSVVFIAAADQGIPDAVSPDVLHRISASLRAG